MSWCCSNALVTLSDPQRGEPRDSETQIRAQADSRDLRRSRPYATGSRPVSIDRGSTTPNVMCHGAQRPFENLVRRVESSRTEVQYDVADEVWAFCDQFTKKISPIKKIYWVPNAQRLVHQAEINTAFDAQGNKEVSRRVVQRSLGGPN